MIIYKCGESLSIKQGEKPKVDYCKDSYQEGNAGEWFLLIPLFDNLNFLY